MQTSTDHEIAALEEPLNLADGHATNEFISLKTSLEDVMQTWKDCRRVSIPEAEARFRGAFARLIGSPTLAKWKKFKICPTASLSIQIIGTVLATLRKMTLLFEPTFDNLALLLRRQNVQLSSIDEREFIEPATDGRPDDYLASLGGDAIFIVNPNNPTGRSLTRADLKRLAQHCAITRKLLVLDNSFRLFSRERYDDYRVLAETGVSFIALEDTGKSVPAQELKASLLACSADLEPLVSEIYNEIFLCTAQFSLLLLERYLKRYHERGLRNVLWRTVDKRRNQIRSAICGSALTVADGCIDSRLPVEWIDCSGTGMNDLEVTEYFETHGLQVLPGRHFFWNSPQRPRSQNFIRLAMLKPHARFERTIQRLAELAHVGNFDRSER